MNKLLIVFLIILSLTQISFTIDKSSYFEFGKKFDAKHFVAPNQSIDSIDVFVFFRVANNNILFKNINNQLVSNPIIEIVAKDNQGITRLRDQWKENYTVNTYQNTTSKTDFLKAYFRFTLENKDHKLTVKYYQSINSNPETIELNIQNLFFKKNIGNNPLFYKELSSFAKTPFINKSGYAFETTGANILIPTKFDSNNELSYTIEKIEKPESTNSKKSKSKKLENEFEKLMDWGDDIKIDGSCSIIKYSNIAVDRVNNDIKFYMDNNNGENQFLNIKLPTETLTPGLYKLNVLNKDENIMEIRFPLEWESKPISLLDPEFAIDKMYYILNDEEFEKYKSLDDELLFEKLIEYWKKNDPTPYTPFNEKMTQYFNRVDYSFFNFSTLAEKDGAKTDRGKVYILKGSPSRIINNTIKGEEYEIWEYDKLNQIYKFELIASGVYRLKEIEDIN